MAYCSESDFKDTVLKAPSSGEIDEGTQYIDALARRLGVAAVKTPVAFEVKNLAIAYTYMRRAQNLSGKAPPGQNRDAYGQKFADYRSEVTFWESKIDAKLLSDATVGTGKRFQISIPMARC